MPYRRDDWRFPWNSADLTPDDRHGIVPDEDRTVSAAAAKRLAHPDDPRLHGLTLDGLLGSIR
ncbi:MAG: hypothetical protein L0H84_06320 [Pseudonocardia sp.]|nr:hypothetical protein [Pseudonocardia sp.]